MNNIHGARHANRIRGVEGGGIIRRSHKDQWQFACSLARQTRGEMIKTDLDALPTRVQHSSLYLILMF